MYYISTYGKSHVPTTLWEWSATADVPTARAWIYAVDASVGGNGLCKFEWQKLHRGYVAMCFVLRIALPLSLVAPHFAGDKFPPNKQNSMVPSLGKRNVPMLELQRFLCPPCRPRLP